MNIPKERRSSVVGGGAIMMSLTDHDDDHGGGGGGSDKNDDDIVRHPEILLNELESLNLDSEDEDQITLSKPVLVNPSSTKSSPLSSSSSSSSKSASNSFMLFNEREELLIHNAEEFSSRLRPHLPPSSRSTASKSSSDPVKIVSIVGNAGDGKSHALNRIFFEDKPVFRTEPTTGVWCASSLAPDFTDSNSYVVVLDTEGLLGHETKALRQILKIVAVSDVVIYKTNSERLRNDLFYFLGDASKAYNNHFSPEIRQMADKENSAKWKRSNLETGPSIIIYHETKFTETLIKDVFKPSPEDVIRDRLESMGQNVSAFGKIHYIGFRNDFITTEESTSAVRKLVASEMRDRPTRTLKYVYNVFKTLNEKFNGELTSATNHRSFPDEYFTCSAKCLSCANKCNKPMNHSDNHVTDVSCKYQKNFDNKNYLCLKCKQNGRRMVVVPKASSSQEGTWLGLATYAWSGFVLECSTCGVIYRSRQHWYGNQSPENLIVVHTELTHIWPGERTPQGTHNAARMLLDGVSNLSGTVSSLSSVAPTKTMTNWVTDRIAPDYWRPNSDISNCFSCDKRLNNSTKPGFQIHHCRSCGEGFCESCSDYKRPCSQRGWGLDPVRVCKPCYDKPDRQKNEPCQNVQARKVSERVVESLSALTSVVLDYPMTILKETARPDYWVPDEECTECNNCSKPFDHSMNSSMTTSSSSVNAGGVHHCRQCGQGVCGECSKTRRPVPQRGWDHPVRICDQCL